MFDLNEFKGNIGSSSVSPVNRFKVDIAVPNVLSGMLVPNNGGRGMSALDTTKLMSFRAEQVKAPGITLNSSDVYRHGIGVRESMPYSGSYTDNTITFLSDGYGNIWSFWYLWLREIFQFAGDDNFTGGTNFNSLPLYQLSYKDDYAVRITITMYNYDQQPVQIINMYDAFPVSINDTQLNWGSNNQALRITVGLSFKEITIEGAGINKPTVGTGLPPSPTTPNLPILATSPTGTTGNFVP